MGRSKRLDTTTVVAEQIFLKSPRSNLEAILHFNAKGEPTLGFYDEKQKNRMKISLTQDGVPFISLFDEQLRGCLNIRAQTVGGRGSAIASFGSSSNNRCLELGVAPGDLPFIHLNDDAGQNRVVLQMMKDGMTAFQLISPDGKRAIQLLSTPDSSPPRLRITGETDEIYPISK